MTAKPGLYLVLLAAHCCFSFLIQGQGLTVLSIFALSCDLHQNKPKAESAATDDCLTSYPYTYVQVQQILTERLLCQALYLKCGFMEKIGKSCDTRLL